MLFPTELQGPHSGKGGIRTRDTLRCACFRGRFLDLPNPFRVVPPCGIEPQTSCFSDRRSTC